MVAKRRATAITQALGRRIATLRLAAGLSQDAFAAQLDTVKSVVSRMERGRALPSMTRLIEMADVLRVELREFFAFEVTPPPPEDDDSDAANAARRIAALIRALSPEDARMITRGVETLARRLRQRQPGR